MERLNQPIEDKQGNKSKQTYYQKALANLEDPTNEATRAVYDEIDDFKIFDPSLPGNRWILQTKKGSVRDQRD